MRRNCRSGSVIDFSDSTRSTSDGSQEAMENRYPFGSLQQYDLSP
jgi:hypothetical protein